MGMDTSTGTQNMSFQDNVAGSMDSRGTSMDITRNVAFMQDTTLSEFFQRPVKILETDWSVNTPLFQRFNPWALFWENPRNLEKISNYYLLKCNLHLKVLINGNAFYYGRAIMAYEPLSSSDDLSANLLKRRAAYTNADLVRLSQRMHVYLNPTECVGGSLLLPFFYPKNALRIPRKEWSELGECVLMSINNLQHANGGTDPITISVLAWAENVSYAIPTAYTPANTLKTVPEMADEHEQAVISRPASTVARYARALTNIPWIGPFARATEIGAGAVSAIAKIFGYSAPVELNYNMMVPAPRPSLAVVDTKYPANKLSVDSKQEVTIDPTTTGIRNDDELPIASIAGRESYLETFNWSINDTPEKCLYQIRVDPFLRRAQGNEHHFTACAAAVYPFRYWRGTMRFRFQIVSSSYHKGRIRLVYDPYAGVVNPEYNTHYTTVHDISSEKDFTIDIGWAQDEPYRRHLLPSQTGTSTSDTIALDHIEGATNGVLSFHVMNQLTVPGTVVSDVQVNVFVSMLEDFEVAQPSDTIGEYKLRDPTQSVPVFKTVPEMADGMEDDADCCDTPVADPPTIDTMADTLIETPETTKLFFGEVIGSFRQMMKRDSLHEVIHIDDNSASTYARIARRAFPEFGGAYPRGAYANSMVLIYGNNSQYIPCAMTWVNYVAMMFAGWRGSVRWTYDTSMLNVSGGEDVFNSVTATYSREDVTSRTNTFVLTNPSTMLPLTNVVTTMLDRGTGEALRGAYLGNTGVNPIQSIEVPFYSNKRFYPVLKDYGFDVSVEEPSYQWSAILPGTNDDADLSLLRVYCSAGEDFNLFFFNGMPPLYYSPSFPSDPGPAI